MMKNLNDSQFMDDPEFQSLLVGCLESLERGETIDLEALAKDFPKYADEVGQFLEDRQMLEQAAAQFAEVEPSQVAVSGFEATVASSPRIDDFVAGDTIRYIGEYEILEEIARGGMGIVFKAKQQQLNRIVALKMILAGKLADAGDVKRFHREAKAAGQLKYPNIVPVHEIGEHEGRHYFTMDFVDGRSLSEEIREESLAPRRAAEIVKTAAEAVYFAHDKGTVHRDLKPANVLLTEDDTPHITDFGLAKMMDAVDETSRAELTASGQILGTPSYMSPEQASGKQELVGPASDIYSLGAILYACLTGRAPFVADSPVDTLLQVLRNEPVSPRTLNPSVPKDLETICLKCLSKEPHKRYGTAQELSDDLDRFLEGHPVVARPVGPISKTIRWCRRNKSIAALLCLLFLSLAVGTYVSASYAVDAVRHAQDEAKQRAKAETAREQAEDQRKRAELSQVEAEEQRDAAAKAKAQAEWSLSQEAEALRQAEKARQAEAEARQAAETSLANAEQARREAELQRTEAQWQTYVARLQPIMYRWEQQEYGQLESMLDQAIPTADDEPDFRGWEWHYLRNLCRQRTSSIDESSTFDQHFDWHPGTKRLAVFRDNQLEIWTGESPEFQSRIAGHSPGMVRFSPSGTQLAVADKFKISIVGVGSGKTTATIDLAAHPNTNRESKEIKSLDWRPDGAALATGTNMGAIHLWNPENGELIKPITAIPNNYPCNDMHWHPSDNILAVGARYGLVFAIDTEQDKPAWYKKIDRDYVFTVRWNPSGTMLAGGTGDGSDGAKFVVWDRQGSEKMRSAKGAFTGIPSIDWLDDQELVVATTDQDIHQFQIDQDEPLQTIRVHDRPVQRILQYGDSRQVITSTVNEIRTTRLDSDVTLAIATPVHKHGIKGISWNPDSRRVATVAWDGLVAITDVAAGEVLHKLDGHAHGAVNGVGWSPDGLRIASCDLSGEFRVWDPAAGELLLKFKGGPGSGAFNSLAWINEHQIVGGQEAIAVYDVNNGQLVRPIADSLGHFANLSYCPKAQRIAHLASSRCAIYDLQGRTIASINCNAEQGLAWSPEGKLLIAGGRSGIVVIDAMHGKVLTTIRGHAGAVNDVCFSPDGSRIASAGSDGTVRVWDRATGAELLILEYGEQKTFTDVSWSPDGSTIAAATAGIVVAWNASPPAEAHRPSSLATGMIASAKTLAEELAEMTKAIAENPSDTKMIRKRGEWYAGQLRWQEALQDFDRLREANPNFSWEPVLAARSALMMNDREGFRKRIDPQVKKLLERGANMPSSTADFIVLTAALVPEATADLSQFLPLAQAHSNAKGNALWASRGVLVLQLRLGHADQVLKLLDRYRDEESLNHRIFLNAARALAHHQRGDAAAAAQALKAAKQQADKAWFAPAEGEPIAYSDVGIYVEAKVLLDEAIARIQVSQPDQKSEDMPTEPAASLLDQLDSETSRQRIEALQALTKQGAEAASAVPRLIELLNKPDSQEKIWAIRCLGRIGPKAGAAAPKLLEIFESDASLTGPRFEAANALARMGTAGEVVIPKLIDLLENPGESKKSFLEKKKVEAPSAEGYAAMFYRSDETGTYTDQRDMIQLHAVGCLAEIGPPAKAAIPVIRSIQNDPDTLPIVRELAKKAIKRISGDDIGPKQNQ